jgi:hypothetical protein
MNSYKYFLVDNTTPVRVAFNEQGLTLGAEVPDPRSRALRVDFDALHRVEKGPWVEEIARELFEALCEEIAREQS